MEIFLGVILIIALIVMAYCCIKGHNLMVVMLIMTTLFTVIALIGNYFSPNSSMEGQSVVDVLTYVYQTGPSNWASSLLVNIFFGAFFGRVLIETGIASSLIRKTVELGGDKPVITMSLVCAVTAVLFTSLYGAGPVIAIGVIVLPILLSLGIPAPIALFAFAGSIMAGMHPNILNYQYYIAMYSALKPEFASYTYEDNFPFAMVCWVIAVIIVIIVSSLALVRVKTRRNWAVTTVKTPQQDAPVYSWIAVLLPVIGVLAFNLPVIFCFIISSLYAMLCCGKLKGGFTKVAQLFQKLFVEGCNDTAPMIGFLLVLAMFNNSSAYVAPYFQQLIGGLIPTSPLILSIGLGLLSFLGFFRGPLNLVGCGAAILAIILNSPANFPVTFIYPVLTALTMTVQHVDITQSWVAWGFGYLKVDSKEYMKLSLPTGYVIAFLHCIAAYVLAYVI